MTAPTCDTRSGCITCGDEGIPMRVLEVGQDGAVCVDEAGTRHDIAMDLVGSVVLGERVLVHAGVAIGTMA